jgi:phage-related protein
MEGPAEQAKRLAANVMTFMQDVGAPAAQTLGPFLLALNQLGPAMMLPVRGATFLGGAIGAGLGKAITKTGPLISRFGGLLTRGLGGVMGKLGPAMMSGLTGILPMLGSAVSGLMSGLVGLLSAAMPILIAAWPLLLIGAIVAGIALLLSNPEIREKVFGFIGGVIEWIGDALSGLAEFLGDIFGTAFDFVATVVGKYLEIITFPIRTFIGFLAGMWGPVTDAVSAAWDFISDVIGGVIDFVGGVIQGFMDFLSTIWTGTVEGATTVWTTVQTVIAGIVEVITGIFTTFVGFIGTIWDGVIGAATAVWNGVRDVISGIVNTITGIIGGITGVVQGVWDTVSGFFGFITGQTETAKAQMYDVGNAGKAYIPGSSTWEQSHPTYAEGTMDTGPSMGLAMLHPHEMVVPRGMAEAIRRSISGQEHAAPAASGNQITVNINQPVRVRSPHEVAGPLRSLAALGVFDAKPG